MKPNIEDYLETFAGFVLLAACIGFMYSNCKDLSTYQCFSNKEYKCTKSGIVANKSECLIYEFVEK